MSLSRDELKERKALEEARKQGKAPAALDEDGKEINPHIPQYIAQAPWYLNKEGPGLKHQRSAQKTSYDNTWYERGAKGAQATKWRKGACQNCGAMTHKTKDCCERPRKVGAKWNGKDIRPDEVVQDLVLDYDGKRDRWNGYDASEHMKAMEEFEKAEQERRKKRKEEQMNKFMTEVDEDYGRYPIGNDKESKQLSTLVDADSDSDSDNEDDEKRDFIDQGDQANVKVNQDPKTRTTIRNLRIREDTAIYLKDLKPEAPHYDPKSRSMKSTDETESEFVRPTSGDARAFNEIQMYAWQAYEKGQNIHLTAAPSQAELAFQEYRQKKDVLTKEQREAILAKYGGKEHLQAPPKELLLAQTEQFVTYAPDGSVMRGKEKIIPKSKYEEDVYINNHTSVWGSFWENGQWGYACCHQFIKNSYCIGKSGLEVKEKIQEEMKERVEQKTSMVHTIIPLYLPNTIQQTEESQKATTEEDRKRKSSGKGYNSMADTSVTEQEMEEYRLKKVRNEDPMKAFLT
jgi:pre-mRNA-processing factor SLU7